MDDKLIGSVVQSFRNNKSIRSNLEGKGKLVIDQKLPYLCVYRYSNQPDRFMASLLTTQAAYLLAEETLDIQPLLEQLSEAGMDEFKAFMIVEIWSSEAEPPAFCIQYPQGKVSGVINLLEKQLKELTTEVPEIEVQTETDAGRGPSGMIPLLDMSQVQQSGVLLIGIAVPPLFRDRDRVHSYPLFFREIQSKFGVILKRAAFELIQGKHQTRFLNYHMLGKTRMDHMVRSADKRLAEIDQKMDFLLAVTPVNATSEWENFRESQFSKPPKFRYRLISIDPELEKRKLFQIPLEKIEHTTLAYLLRDKRTELEKQLIMLEERGTRKFFHTSQSIYGDIDRETINTAKALLVADLPNEQAEPEYVNAADFAQIADAEIGRYKSLFPSVPLSVKIKESVTGLMVSGPELSVGKDLNISTGRVNPLIQHEIGTHMLTYCNGKQQPLKLMYSGFAGYEQLQEGIAVLAEFLVGGLNVNRLRLVAARVLAVDALIHGADFIETFQILTHDYDFSGKAAFNIAMRVFRGGGFTKDAIYLKGLLQVLNFIKQGGDLHALYAGKYALEHLPLIEELEYVQILKKPVLPAFLESAEAKERIQKIKSGIQLVELVA